MSEEKIPEYIKPQSDGSVIVETKEGTFHLEEESGEVVDAVLKLQDKFGWTEFRTGVILAARCCKNPKLSDMDVLKYKKSTLIRLSEAYNLLGEDLDDFLSTTEESTQKTIGKESNAE